MVESTGITIETVYLDGREKNVLAGGVSSIEDDTVVHIADSRTTGTNRRSSRVRRGWQLSWSSASSFVSDLFEICGNATGFIFISPIDEERIVTASPAKNTVTDLTTGDGTTTTFQLQRQVSLSRSIGSGSISSEAFDINYPLAGTLTVYVDGSPVAVTGFSLSTGIATLTAAPANGLEVTATFQHGWPVMFTSKTISQTLLQVDQKELRSAQIEEIF